MTPSLCSGRRPLSPHKLLRQEGAPCFPVRTFPSCRQRGLAQDGADDPSETRELPRSHREQGRGAAQRLRGLSSRSSSKAPPGCPPPPTPLRPLLSIPLSTKPPSGCPSRTGSFLHQPQKSFPELRVPDVMGYAEDGGRRECDAQPHRLAGSGDSPRVAHSLCCFSDSLGRLQAILVQRPHPGSAQKLWGAPSSRTPQRFPEDGASGRAGALTRRSSGPAPAPGAPGGSAGGCRARAPAGFPSGEPSGRGCARGPFFPLKDASSAPRLPKPLTKWLCFVSPVSG